MERNGKVCGNCGSQMDDNATFCPKCGAGVNGQMQNQNQMPNQMNMNNMNPMFQQGMMGMQQPKKSAGLAIASMVLGIVSLVLGCCIPYVTFFTALVGLVMSGASLGMKMGGKGMAIAGLVCNIISLIPAVIVLLAFGGSITTLF